MFGIITTGIIATLIQIGIGEITGRFLLRQTSSSVSTSFWMGWVSIIAFLQLWQLAFPIFWPATLVVAGLGIIGMWQWKNGGISRPRWIWLLVGGVALILISNSGLASPVFYDNGLYHFQSMRWVESYPIVPGLGNLHGRLAFNSSYFLYVVWLNYIIPGIAGFRIANGLVTIVLLLEAIGALAVGFRNRQWTPHRLMAAVLPFPILFTAFDPLANYLASPTSDYFVFVLTLKIGWTLLRFLEPTEDNSAHGWVLIALSIALITIKLSGGVFAAFVVVLVAALLRGRYKQRNQSLTPLWGGMGTIAVVLLAPWLYRNVIVSGYLVYPSTALPFPVDWRIPMSQAIDDTRWVQAWARRPKVEIHWSEVLQNWEWLTGWEVNFWRTRGIRLSIILALGAWGVTLVSTLGLRRFPTITKTLFLWSLPAVVALIIWFASAPDPRFALAYFWLIALGGCVATLESVPNLNIVIERLLVFRLTERVIAASIVVLLLVSHGLRWNTEAAPVPVAEIQSYTTSTGLVVYIPKNGSELCWNTPLPCTPYPQPALRLRIPNNLGSGFIQE